MPVAGRYEHCGLTDEEGRQLQQIVRRANTARSGGRADIMASASGASVSGDRPAARRRRFLRR
jgi:hypothetical protein